jgi:response regulator of citrate/malate metabolism
MPTKPGTKKGTEHEVLAALDAADRPLSSTEIAALVGRSRTSVIQYLHIHLRSGRVVCQESGLRRGRKRYSSGQHPQ